jgi:hypothetical protein
MDYGNVIRGEKTVKALLHIAVEELIKIRKVMEEDLKLKRIQHDLTQRSGGVYPK